MSAIKFSKQTIHPNPKEVDYWVDISKNPYGNVIKYFNGQDWVDLAYTGGLPDLSSYYTKVQVNELLNKKADAVEVDKLVSDEEIANVINNISFTTSNPNSVDLVKFNFDGTAVAVTLPIASNTTAGIVSSDDFKDFVKQWQLQKLYIEMYGLFADIRAKYQRKLKPGLNIVIDQETDTIHATSDISLDYDKLYNKPDLDQMFSDVYTEILTEEDRAKAEEERLGQRITDHVDVVKAELDLKADKKDMYTKDQVDQKVSSVYRVIGSSTFEELPTEGNTIGDVYNITNDFTLNGIEYPFGTNLVWTADGWDTLSGVFDTTELEEMVEVVDTKVDEEILRAKAAELNIQTLLDNEIKRAKESEESLKNDINIVDGKLINYLPLSSGVLSGQLGFSGTTYPHIYGNGEQLTLGIKDYRSNFVVVTDTAVQPNVANTGMYLGSPDTRWSNIYSVLGNFSGQITSSVATGTAPFNVSSTTLVSNLNADRLDGYHESDFFRAKGWKGNHGVVDANQALFGAYNYSMSAMANTGTAHGQLIAFNGVPGDFQGGQFVFSSDSRLFSRIHWDGIYNDWKQIAFTDSDITGNAATATKLKTAVKLWGNDFDGSKNINETIYINNIRDIEYKHNLILYDSASTQFGGVYDGEVTKLAGSDICFISGSFGTSATKMIITGNGNVGIGTTSPEYNLDVNGTAMFREGVYLPNNKTIYGLKKDGTVAPIARVNSNNNVLIGNESNITYVRGSSVFLSYGTSNGLTLDSNGQIKILNSLSVGAGLNADRKNEYTLGVYGTLGVKENATFEKEVSGDFVDWYGVEWTDSQSDPALTRIGNMSYHRSLPIQSGMKGYVIMQAVATNGEMILPLTDDWSKIKFATASNGATGIGDFTNTVVKIPEYWYIHEYDETTGTHQLKLSQTAKAGWLHHKEAYVGAYEGYSDGTYYISVKGQVPTVSVTRETIRGLARANGYADEYKWNIYTYEEHKAICHLFMVEYATRNSQADVNTELTADGFKQGGLGSGCTTGSVTIDGATKYSFIPTGVTDSLGNGSGQVAYTVTQTDADGNETGTVTRYANRYRGIENPFGHIWKQCDDVISKYDAAAVYRTFYKCDKPEHFATNKNTKYKPVCSAPVAEGYKKTLKHTIVLDLFAYEVGGSASTYWCDYNYDNTDTAEHCLLIGGTSHYGTIAGLFSLDSHYGVGISLVRIGSRLTYLPWAE